MIRVYTKTTLERNHRGTGSWASWEKRWDTSVTTVEAGPDFILGDEYGEAFDFDVELKPGENAYVLYQTYSDGDSFGTERGLLQVLGVFPTKDLLQKARGTVSKAFEHGHSNTKEFDLMVNEDGKMIKVRNRAAGHFQSQQSLEVTVLTVA